MSNNQQTTRLRWTFPAALILFLLNVWICRELFTAEFLNNLASNEGVFASLGRFYRIHATDLRWFPWFNAGMPIEYAYQPLLPALSALTAATTGWSAVRALHFVLALAYCLGPVTLFWFALDWSKSLATGVIAGAAYSLFSAAPAFFPVLGDHAATRLFNLVWYAEDPHNLALTLLPVSLLWLRRAILDPHAKNMILAALSAGALVTSNAFGSVGIAIGAAAIILTLNRGYKTTAIVGLCAWCWISPWMPPSLLAKIREGASTSSGLFAAGASAYVAMLTVATLFAAVWYFTKTLGASFHRFVLLFSVIMMAIPVGYFWFHVTLAPIPSRYQLELEMALSLLFGCACSWIFRRSNRTLRIAIASVLLIAGCRQALVYRHFAAGLLTPLDITKSIEYKVSTWIDHNLPGQRTMVSGDTEYVFNLFSDNPQLSASHDPTAPNWMQRVAVYTIHSGDGAGDRDAEYSVFWLKAFGNQAVYVPGPASRDFYRIFAHAKKFEGMLPVLWHEEDDTIYGVPQRSKSFAHVIPQSAMVTKRPIHGLDMAPAEAYVAALDDPGAPACESRLEFTIHGHYRNNIKGGPGHFGSIHMDAGLGSDSEWKIHPSAWRSAWLNRHRTGLRRPM